MEIPRALQDLIQESNILELAESLNQNKKNNKRTITDVAISKIPYVAYPELNTEQCLIIHELAEHLLLLAKEQNNSNEIAITYNLDNNDSLEFGMNNILNNTGICYGTENETDLFSDSKTMAIINRAKSVAIVNLHNHPSCNTFSIQDISLFLKESALKLMIVLGNNGELYYLSKNLEKYNYNQARQYLMTAINIIIPNIKNGTQQFLTYNEALEISSLFLKNCNNFGIEYRHVLGSNKPFEQLKELKEQKEECEHADRDDY